MSRPDLAQQLRALGYPSARMSGAVRAAFFDEIQRARRWARVKQVLHVLLVAVLVTVGAAGAFATVWSISHWPKRTPPVAPEIARGR
jgi:hypothetical protein